MNRRLILSLVAGGIATPVLAQMTNSGTSSGMAPSNAGPALGKAEMDHAMQTAMAGNESLLMADVALEKAHNAKVKEFAKFEHDEQTTIAEILKSMDPAMQPPKPSAQAAEMLEKLKGASGAAFDKAFITGQIEGHEKLLDIQESYLNVGKDRETIAVTKLARGMIKEHLALLSDLRKMAG